eukprot:9735698-Prorocentrum_lima.AAC.1
MTSSLVGSEMCIRDRSSGASSFANVRRRSNQWPSANSKSAGLTRSAARTCLLYTSDAADDM